VLIAGTGALACAFGARLARAGAAVTLAGSWREALAAISARGILVHEGAQTSAWSTRVDALSLDRLPGSWPLALVLVKSPRTAAVAEALDRRLDPSGLAVTLQNGLGQCETLAATLGPARVASGVAIMGASVLAPGEVRFVPGRVILDADSSNALLRSGIVALLEAAGIPTELTADIEAAVWRKLVANCVINPLTALHELTNGALLERDELRSQLVLAAREVAAVAAAKGIALGADGAEIAITVARATASNRSSMLADLTRGAPTEIDALCGAVVREGRRLGVDTSINEGLWRLVRAREGRPLEGEDA
jgi:2-dehydropantoate 2-reductase